MPAAAAAAGIVEKEGIMEQALLEMWGITKEFPGVKALTDVSLTLRRGEVLALLGENGAGKSTLLKVLSGVYIPNSGEIYLNGQKCSFTRPVESLQAGISIIHQELNYLNDLSIGENIFMGRLPKKHHMIDWETIERESAKALEQVGFPADPHRVMRTLSVAEKQLVEIAKAISREMKVLVMDEPTSALNDKEVEALLRLVRKIASAGVGVIYISHRMQEIYEVADRVQILRDGCAVGDFPVEGVSEEVLISHMVGREIGAMYTKRELPLGEVVLDVQGVTSARVHDISFHVRKGEILGVFGLMGCGRTYMAETIFGKNPIFKGSVSVLGRKIRLRSPLDAKRAGIGYVPAERKSEGLILSHTVAQNISLATIGQLKHRGVISAKKEQINARTWIERFKIKTPSEETVVNNLSGGNQQKVVLAKWLQTNPKVLILNEPTRGIDVGAKAEIYALMEQLCEQGMAIVMISSELPEVLALCDRVCVMSEGTIVGEVSERSRMTQEVLMKYAISRVGGTNYET